MRFLSVSSGIEAASVAWAPLGWKAAAFSEIAPFPSAVLAHHYPDVPNHGDMTKFEEWPNHDVDLLVGGTPCQDFSIAGLRSGLDGERGQLMLTYAAIARKCRPRWLVWENVPGVLSDDKGRGFASLLGLLSGQRIEVPPGGWKSAGVVEGYSRAYGLAWRVLDAQYIRVDGYARAVPQRRRRVFVVGYLGDWRRAASVLFERESLSGDPAPRREAGKGFAHDVVPSLVSSGRGLERTGETRGQDPVVAELVAYGGNNTSGPIDVATAVRAKGGSGHNDFESETFVAHALRGEGFDASEDGTGRGTPLVPIAFSAKDHGADAMTDCSPTLRAGGHSESHANAGVMPAIAFNARQDPDVYAGHTGPLDTDGSTQGILQYGGDHASTQEANSGALLRGVRDALGAEVFAEWGLGILDTLQPAEILRSALHGCELRPAAFSRRWVVHCALSRQEDRAKGAMLSMREAAGEGRAPQRREPSEQLARELGAYLSGLSQPGTQAERFMHDLWFASEGIGFLRQALSAVQAARRPARSEDQSVLAGWRVRRLMVEECEFLQGFPRGYTAITYRGKPAVDGPRYKALGNSMAVNCMRWIGMRIQHCEQITREAAE